MTSSARRSGARNSAGVLTSMGTRPRDRRAVLVTEEGEMEQATHAYIGKAKCGHIRFAYVDEPGEQAETLREVAKAAKRLHIERVTVEEARTGWGTCDVCRPAKRSRVSR